MLISEGHSDGLHIPKGSLVSHLDKSHITVHTYPETHPDNGISTFAAISTSPPAARFRR